MIIEQMNYDYMNKINIYVITVKQIATYKLIKLDLIKFYFIPKISMLIKIYYKIEICKNIPFLLQTSRSKI